MCNATPSPSERAVWKSPAKMHMLPACKGPIGRALLQLSLQGRERRTCGII